MLNLIAAFEPAMPGEGGGTGSVSQFGSTGLKPAETAKGLAAFNYEKPLESTELLISNVIGVITVLGALIFVFMFIYGAIKWITGGDDAAKVGKARDQMIQGVIGLIIMVAAYAIVGLIGTIVGIDILNPATQIETIFGL